MHEAPLAAWESFYVIVGSSAAALTGLMFVVVTLIDARNRTNPSGETLSAFATPNVIHFCAALLVSAILSAPWPTLWQAGVAVSLCGITGLTYGAIVIRRVRRQKDYKPVFEDWLWHVILPVVAYATLTVAVIVIGRRPTVALFSVAGATVLLLFIGIHNSWDTITYLALEHVQPREEPKP